MNLVEIALEYAHRTWPVFPLEPRGKQPLGRLVPHGLKQATTDAAVIQRWWNEEPQANIGVPTGVAFDVCDCDGEKANRRFQAVFAEHGEDARQLPRITTGGGGRHVLFAPTGVGNRTRFLPEIDWRGIGGYIVAPGSVHPNGHHYNWITDPNGDGFPVAPSWLLELLQGPQTATPLRVLEGGTSKPSAAYLKAAVEAELEKLRTASEGTRNDSLNRVAFVIGQLVGAGWISQISAELDLQRAGGAVGLVEPELLRTIRSGLEAGIADPRQPPPGGFSQAEAGGEIRRRSEETESISTEGFDALVEPGPVWALKAGEKVPVIAQGLLVAGGLGMVISDPKAGKTWMVLELATCVVNRLPVFGQYAVEQSGRVLYIVTEGTREGTLGRLRALALGHGVDPERTLNGIDFIWRKGVRLDDPAFVQWLIDHATDYTLMMVDVLIEAWDGDENKTSDVSRLMRAIRPVTDAGATLLLLHHLSKPHEGDARSIWQRIRGSTTFFGAFDSGIGLERPQGGKRTKVSFQHRDLAPLDPFTFAWPMKEMDGSQPVNLDWQPVEDLAEQHALEERILDLVAQRPGLSKSEITEQIGGRRTDSYDAINGLIASRQIHIEEGTFRRSDGRLGHKKGLRVVGIPEFHGSSQETGTPMNHGSSQPWEQTGTPTDGSSEAVVPTSVYTPPLRGGVQRVGPPSLTPGTGMACPACGSPAYSLRGKQHRCHKCGELYG